MVVLSDKTKRIFVGIILFGLLGVGVYFLYINLSKENYSSIFNIDSNYKPNFEEDTIIIPPFQEDYFKQDKGDYNEYQYNNKQIEIKKYPWLKNTFIGQVQKPQDSNNPQPFLSF